jgi:predicted nucleic acid-binding protein
MAVKHRPLLYIETSVFGFYYDEREVNRSKRDATRRLFDQIRAGLFSGYTGAATVLELERTRDRQLRAAVLDPMNDSGVQLLRLDTDAQRDVALLAEEYVSKGAIPPAKVDDAIHIATMVVRPELDILVTWNCRHIANLSVERKVKALTLNVGYGFNFQTMTPEEVVVYEA